MEEFRDDPEALTWLQTNPDSDSGFASNRFTMDKAIQFVQQLYAQGATKVVIPQSSIREEEMADGTITPYADAMVVFYEPNVATNETLVRTCLQEIEAEGFLMKEGGTEPVTIEVALPSAMAETSFYLWWD